VTIPLLHSTPKQTGFVLPDIPPYWLPRVKPLGPVQLDYANPLTRYFSALYLSGVAIDLVTKAVTYNTVSLPIWWQTRYIGSTADVLDPTGSYAIVADWDWAGSAGKSELIIRKLDTWAVGDMRWSLSIKYDTDEVFWGAAGQTSRRFYGINAYVGQRIILVLWSNGVNKTSIFINGKLLYTIATILTFDSDTEATLTIGGGVGDSAKGGYMVGCANGLSEGDALELSRNPYQILKPA